MWNAAVPATINVAMTTHNPMGALGVGEGAGTGESAAITRTLCPALTCPVEENGWYPSILMSTVYVPASTSWKESGVIPT